MFGREEVDASQAKVPRGLSLEEARELERGDAILQLRMSKPLLLAPLNLRVR